MAIVWLSRLFRWGMMLLVPPPGGAIRKLDRDARCPSCGHGHGRLEFARVVLQQGDPEVAVVTHHCHECRFAWHELPVGRPEFPAK